MEINGIEHETMLNNHMLAENGGNTANGAETKEKVKIYAEYLEAYLSIMAFLPNIEKIRIYEPFAGSGKDGSFAGSVPAALRTIKAVRKKYDNLAAKEISYYINDLKPDNYQTLCSRYANEPIVTVSNQDAKVFIGEQLGQLRAREHFSTAVLWFIDPYGYTQVDKSDIEKIFGKQGVGDIIIFIPSRFITRFVGSQKDPAADKTPPSVKRFLEDNGIRLDDVKQDRSAEHFAKLLIDNLRRQYPNSFFQSYTLSLNSSGNDFSLLFMSGHILGAEKFLEATERVHSDIRSGLFKAPPPIRPEDKIEECREYMGKDKKSNVDLYLWGINNGLRSTPMKKLVKLLIEKYNLQKEQHPDFSGKITKSGLYIDRKHYDDSAHKVLYFFNQDNLF